MASRIYTYFIFGWLVCPGRPVAVPFNTEGCIDRPITGRQEIQALESGIRDRMVRENQISPETLVLVANFQLLREEAVGSQY